LPSRKEPHHITAKYTSSGGAILATSSGREVIVPPCRAKSTTMVKSRP
jgi:hypothetical protein